MDKITTEGKKKHYYQGIRFDSKEEIYFYWWLSELGERGIIENIEMQPEKIVMSDAVYETYIDDTGKKQKVKTSKIIGEKVYTPDFKICWAKNSEYFNFAWIGFASRKPTDYIISIREWGSKTIIGRAYIEVKGKYDQNNMTTGFMIKQAWIYDKHGIFVNLVKISNKAKSYFDMTFTPERFLWTDTGVKERKLHYVPVMLDDFLNNGKL